MSSVLLKALTDATRSGLTVEFTRRGDGVAPQPELHVIRVALGDAYLEWRERYASPEQDIEIARFLWEQIGRQS